MRRLRYNCAVSLDGFIADPDGGYAWIVEDDSIDFTALFASFDTFVMGRKTWDIMQAQGDANPLRRERVIVASRTMTEPQPPNVTVVRSDIVDHVAALKAEPGERDIWLFGGSDLAGQMFDAGLVDRLEVALMPVLLRQGIPLVAPGGLHKLALVEAQSLPSGIQMLTYNVMP